MKNSKYKSVAELIEAIGRKNITDLGYTSTDISRAISENLIPSGWFDDLEKLTSERLPRNLFRWSKAQRNRLGLK